VHCRLLKIISVATYYSFPTNALHQKANTFRYTLLFEDGSYSRLFGGGGGMARLSPSSAWQPRAAKVVAELACAAKVVAARSRGGELKHKRHSSILSEPKLDPPLPCLPPYL